MKLRITSLALLLAVLAAFVAAPLGASAAAPGKGSVAVPVTGTGTNSTFSGVLNVTSFAVRNGQLVANGTLTGTLTNTVTGATQAVSQAVTAPVAARGSCQILHLELGPLDPNLLGLMVHLDRVVLDITAQSGPGNLLGNLLCAVANLLNNPSGALTGVANLLNKILGQL